MRPTTTTRFLTIFSFVITHPFHLFTFTRQAQLLLLAPLLLLPLACSRFPLSLASWLAARDVNNGRFIPPSPLTKDKCRLHSASTTSYPPLTIPISPPDASFPMYLRLSPKLDGLSLSAGQESAVPVESRWVFFSSLLSSCSFWLAMLTSSLDAGFPLGRRTILTGKEQIPRYIFHW